MKPLWFWEDTEMENLASQCRANWRRYMDKLWDDYRLNYGENKLWHGYRKARSYE